MSELDLPYDPDPLEKGTRVRIRLSGECRGWDAADGRLVPHYAPLDGRDGVVLHRGVVRSGWSDDAPSHQYSVRVGQGPHPYGWGWFARAELERL